MKIIDILKGFISKKLFACLGMEALSTWMLISGNIIGLHWTILTGVILVVYLFVQGNIDIGKLKIKIGNDEINMGGGPDTTGTPKA